MFVSTTEIKARSRLVSVSQSASLKPVADRSFSPRSKMGRRFPNTFGFKTPQILMTRLSRAEGLKIAIPADRYLKLLPTLGVSLLLFVPLLYIFTQVSPAHVANVVFYQSYLPVLLLFVTGSFFFCSFIFLSKAKGALVSLWLGCILFLKLQDFVVTPQTVLISGSILLLGFYLWAVLFRK